MEKYYIVEKDVENSLGFIHHKGYDNLDQAENWQVYSCGPHPMMKALASYCIARKWPCQVSLETLMACGIAACLGCAIRGSGQTADNSKPYLHVCKEGPVFEAGEVAWE